MGQYNLPLDHALESRGGGRERVINQTGRDPRRKGAWNSLSEEKIDESCWVHQARYERTEHNKKGRYMVMS